MKQAVIDTSKTLNDELEKEIQARRERNLELHRQGYQKWLAKRTYHVRERLLRLNPKGHLPGEQLRGYHRRNPRFMPVTYMMATKGDVISKYGREFWNSIPAKYKSKSGKRGYVTQIGIVITSKTIS